MSKKTVCIFNLLANICRRELIYEGYQSVDCRQAEQIL